MTVCELKHEQIVYGGAKCPACDLAEQVSDMEQQVNDKDDEISELQQTADDHEED